MIFVDSRVTFRVYVLVIHVTNSYQFLRFFDLIDANGDLSVSPSELKDFIISQQGDGPIHDIVDELVEIIMERLDADGNGQIEKEEFKFRALRWLRVIRPYIELSHAENEVRKSHDLQSSTYISKEYIIL